MPIPALALRVRQMWVGWIQGIIFAPRRPILKFLLRCGNSAGSQWRNRAASTCAPSACLRSPFGLSETGSACCLDHRRFESSLQRQMRYMPHQTWCTTMWRSITTNRLSSFGMQFSRAILPATRGISRRWQDTACSGAGHRSLGQSDSDFSRVARNDEQRSAYSDTRESPR